MLILAEKNSPPPQKVGMVPEHKATCPCPFGLPRKRSSGELVIPLKLKAGTKVKEECSQTQCNKCTAS